MEIEIYTIPCLIEDNIRNVSIKLFEDELCKITFDDGKNVISSEAEHFWGALIKLRKILETQNIRLYCKGCARNVYPSPMILDMGDADKAYKLSMGQKAVINNLVDIFKPCDPNEYASIEEQLSYYNMWVKSVSAN